jgi:hypothetical protein
LVDDNLGVAVGDKSLDSQGNSDAQPVDQGLVPGVLLDTS